MRTKTSWNKVGTWYNKLVGSEGHYFHQHIIIPGVLKALDLSPGDKLLDVGCGQGVLARQIPRGVEYLGIDSSIELVRLAQKSDLGHRYQVADATKNIPVSRDFSHAAVILALQNMEFGDKVLSNISGVLKPGGKLVIVLNHPAFRIPRQSSWEIDAANKLQYRRINRYLSPLKIPIKMNPSDKNSQITWSFHHPISDYFKWLKLSGFTVGDLYEWASDKESVGRASRMENMSRAEFPLFLCLVAIKSP